MTPDLPRVSVVIPAYNAERFVTDAVASVLEQTLKNFELIVVDDGSTDGTVEQVAKRWDPRVRYIRQANRGVCAARNTGVSVARAQYVAFLDADDYWTPHALELLVTYLDEHPAADIVYGEAHIVDERGQATGRRLRCIPGPVPVRDLIIRNVVPMSAVALRRSAFQRAGGMDPAFRGAEDHDLWVRIALLRNGNIHGLPDVIATYRQHSGQATRDWSAMYAGGRLLLDKVAGLAPDLVGPLRAEAEGHLCRYTGFIAFESGDIRQARALLFAASRRPSWSLLTDRRFWLLVALVGSRSVVPGRLHSKLYAAARSVQGWLAARTGRSRSRRTPATRALDV